MTPQTPTAVAPVASAGHPSEESAAAGPTPAVQLVHRFLQDLRRRDLGALAALLNAGGHPDDGAARDGAQAVLRSMGGSGLVDADLHPSTDGNTVFVDFRREHPDTDTGGGRLLRFTTNAGFITAIREYVDAEQGDGRSCPAELGDPGGPARRSPDPGASPTAPCAGGVDWPSLNDDRAGTRRVGGH